ncbi:general secretion pathway protein GspB [Ningiella sp. W23]|uniref:general secretion pathway protein GspB n=1 Tax=Ningiella sp. W23 TaxID=3023715 RepID=UPI0037576A37
MSQLVVVPIDQLAPGMMVTRVMQQNGPVKIRRVGMIKSNEMVKGLKEMGVLLLEVNQEASLGTSQALEPENEPDTTAAVKDEPPQLNVATVTQRLMAQNKHNEVVDRELSQHFHRSMFMPAVEEMPSKWRLYGQPYSILFACIAFGFLIGLSVFYLPAKIAQSSLLADDADVMQHQADEAPLQVSQPSIMQTPRVDEDEKQVNANAAALNGADVPRSDADSLAAVASAQEKTEGTISAQTPSLSDSDSLSDASNTNIDGVEVEDGQIVLGYVSPELAPELGIQSGANSGAQAPQSSAPQPSGENQASSSSLLSSELLRRVNQAAAELEAEEQFDDVNRDFPNNISQFDDSEIESEAQPAGPAIMQRIDQLPSTILNRIPAMSFSAHMYASSDNERWVRVNGRRLMEGDEIENGLRIEAIEPEKVILSFSGETFSINALSDW